MKFRAHLGRLGAALLLAALVTGCASSGSRPAAPMAARPGPGHAEVGIASWYGPGFHGRRTASGERYDMHAMTAAHKTLPFGTNTKGRRY